MATLNERISKLEVQLDENSKTLWRVFEALYGNGKPGLLAEMRALSQKLDTHLDATTQRKFDWQWAVTAIIAVGGIVIAWIK